VGRSAGVHVSAIIRALAVETGHLRPEWVEELSLIEVKPTMRFLDPDVALRVSIGLAWEEWYIPQVLGPEGVIDHPGEYHVDGIYMSPDGEQLSTVIIDSRPQHQLRIHEIKTTAKSINTVGEDAISVGDQFIWMAQLKAYCKGAGTRFADLHVLFLYGSYDRPFMRPKMIRFKIEFTQQEIDENWAMITAYRDFRMTGA
jgi:hypothetical protein